LDLLVRLRVLQFAPFFFNRRARFPFGSCLILTDSDARGFKKSFLPLSPFLFDRLACWFTWRIYLLGCIKFGGETIS